MGAGGGFGVVLDGEDGIPRGADAFDGMVVEVKVGDFDVGGEAVGVNGEAVVLAGDGDGAVAEVFDGVVPAAVAELELVGLSAEGVGEDLGAETDAEDGEAAEELLDLGVDVAEGRRGRRGRWRGRGRRAAGRGLRRRGWWRGGG